MLKVFLLTIFMSTVSHASTIEYSPILDIINTQTRDPATLYVAVKNNALSGLKLITTKRTSTFSFSDVMHGATLLREKGISIISIKGLNLSSRLGGNLSLVYLKNFSILGSSYETINLKIKKNISKWSIVYDANDVSQILLTPHPFGISSHQFN